MNCRVLLADDHQPSREAVRNLLQRHGHIEVVGEAGDGMQAMELTRTLLPDIVVMDIRMPRLNGIGAVSQLRAAHPAVKVIVLSANAAAIFASAMLAAGARGYVTKSDAEELPQAICAVLAGNAYMSSEVAAPAGARTAQDAVSAAALVRKTPLP